jgi:hypothetical protein
MSRRYSVFDRDYKLKQAVSAVPSTRRGQMRTTLPMTSIIK